MKLFIMILVLIPTATLSKLSEINPCWIKENFSVISHCHACPDDELKTVGECQKSGFVETIVCASSGKVLRRLVENESGAFWRFELAMLVTSMLSGLVVMLRMRRLDRDNAERIQRQISAL